MTRGTLSALLGSTASEGEGPPRPRSLCATRFNVGPHELIVFSFPLAEPRIPDMLTPSERDVTLAMLQGLSNAEIAIKRRTSPRTVANQVASIFCKLGISSRAELAGRLMDLYGEDAGPA